MDHITKEKQLRYFELRDGRDFHGKTGRLAVLRHQIRQRGGKDPEKMNVKREQKTKA